MDAARASVCVNDGETCRARHRELAQPQDSGEPALRAPQRHALWIGGGKLAVFGVDHVAASDGAVAARAVGVMVIDTGDWSACILDERAGAAVSSAGQLLTYSGTPSTARREALLGVRAYRSAGGSATFHVLTNQQVWDVDVAGRQAYVRTAQALHVLDTRSRRVVATVPPVEIVDVIR